MGTLTPGKSKWESSSAVINEPDQNELDKTELDQNEQNEPDKNELEQNEQNEQNELNQNELDQNEFGKNEQSSPINNTNTNTNTNTNINTGVILDRKSFELSSKEKEEYSVYFATTQSHTIRTLIESLKDIIPDATLTFTKQGLQILNVTPDNSVVVHVKLLASKFNYYYCSNSYPNNVEEIDLHMRSLFYLLKTVGMGDVVKMFIRKDNKTRLHIIIENKERNVCDISNLKLLDINNAKVQMPNVQFDCEITMNSTNFQKICKDLAHISNKVTIKSSKDKLTFAVKGDIGDKEITCQEDPRRQNGGDTNEFKIKNCELDNTKEINETYSLNYLLTFIKSTNLCSTIDLYLRENYPLVLRYSVGSLGSLKFALLPYIKEDEEEF